VLKLGGGIIVSDLVLYCVLHMYRGMKHWKEKKWRK